MQGANLATFGTGTNSLTLKVQGAPVYNSNWGSYNTTAHDLYHVATRFNANTWRAPTDNSRLLWVYSSATRKLEYYTSYEVGVFQRWANITVPQTAIDAQTVDPGLCFSPGRFAFNGTPYQGTLSDWILSPICLHTRRSTRVLQF